MKGCRSLLLPLLAFFSFQAGAIAKDAAAAGGEFAAFQTAIRALYQVQEEAIAQGDVETIVTRFFAHDAIAAGEGEPLAHVGRDQLRKDYRIFLKTAAAARIESVRTVVNGNAGWDWTNFYVTPKPGTNTSAFVLRVLFLWSKENGKWVCKGSVGVSGKFKNPL